MKTKKSLILILLLSIALLLPLTAAAFGFIKNTEISDTAHSLVSEMNKQLAKNLINHEFTKQDLSIVSTVAVDINDMKKTNALARQMSEDMTSSFAKLGYQLREIRKAEDIVMIEKEGEFVLTRDLKELASTNVLGVAVLTGTYLISKKNMRFSMSLIHVPSNKILAKASADLALDDEMFMEVTERPSSLRPNVQTKLDNY